MNRRFLMVPKPALPRDKKKKPKEENHQYIVQYLLMRVTVQSRTWELPDLDTETSTLAMARGQEESHSRRKRRRGEKVGSNDSTIHTRYKRSAYNVGRRS